MIYMHMFKASAPGLRVTVSVKVTELMSCHVTSTSCRFLVVTDAVFCGYTLRLTFVSHTGSNKTKQSDILSCDFHQVGELSEVEQHTGHQGQ